MLQERKQGSQRDGISSQTYGAASTTGFSGRECRQGTEAEPVPPVLPTTAGPTLGRRTLQDHSVRNVTSHQDQPQVQHITRKKESQQGRVCECGRSQPSFGLSGESRRAARWCAKCPTRPSEAVDVINKRCVCGSRRPSFGLPGEQSRQARWCVQCPTKPPNAVDVVSKRCSCGQRQPSFGLPGELGRQARWCSKCPSKPSCAVDIVSRRNRRLRDPPPSRTRENLSNGTQLTRT
uniref:Uncharacterized protein n=1 Tax=Tetraselmis sp. GSL018 TaxID=582737 RepID=A0A061R214_9CHLO